jgi:hypothetical protein
MATNKMEELDALVIRNLDYIDAAAYRLYQEIEPRICKVINDITKKWADTKSWSGEFDWWKGELWVAPADWQTDDGWLARFFLDGGPEDEFDYLPEEDMFWLTRLCQKGQGRLGFRWNHSVGLGATNSKWKRFIRNHADCVEAIGKKSFEAEDSGLFFTEVKVDASKLAEAVQEGSFETALQPLQAALDRLGASKTQFDTLLKLAKKEFIS